LTASPDSSKDLLRTEMGARVREALILRDWTRLEHWARQWIQLDPRNPSGFKWLARAAVGLGKIQKAAYAYGRLLDFDPKSEEARKFFAEYPSSLRDQGADLRKSQPGTRERSGSPSSEALPPHSPEEARAQTLSPEQRKLLSERLLEAADLHAQMELHARAADLYKDSFGWQPSQAAALGNARSLHKAQKSHEAAQFLLRQIGLFRGWIEGRLLLGRIFYETGQVNAAQREWQEVLKIEPENKEALGFIRALLTRPQV
jgi:tetratricopeptide (TPR) repeat protein